MKDVRIVLSVAVALVALLGAAQVLLRAGGEPDPEELVPWEPYAELGEAPYDGPVLIEFSADWCAPCKRLQVTVFRDPLFVQTLRELSLRPVRIEYDARDALTFDRLQRRYRVQALPSMVVVAPDGRFSPAIEGALTAEQYRRVLGAALARLDNALFWNPPDFVPARDRNRLVLRHFGSWWYLPREGRSDWRENPTAEFSRWITEHADLVGDEFRNFPHGHAYYQRHRVRTAPTLIVEDWRGLELARFEGLPAIERAPGQIARIARERRLEIPDPPTPYADPENKRRR